MLGSMGCVNLPLSGESQRDCARHRRGCLGDVSAVGEGVSEMREHFGLGSILFT